MERSQIEEIVRRCFDAYQSADRGAIESLLHKDFTFTSPYDDHINRSVYFERCWPAAGTFQSFHLIEVVAGDKGCFVLYEGKSAEGVTFRNSEFFRLAGELILSVEVFFGLPPYSEPITPGNKPR